MFRWSSVLHPGTLDLGGTHPPLAGTVNFDARATELGITQGNTYSMEIFHAERHTTQSNFRIETNIPVTTSGLPAMTAAFD